MLRLDPGLRTDALREARERTLAIVAPLPDHDVERVTSPLMSPLVWDLAHIAAYEDLWIAHRLGGLPLLHPERAAIYDAFETPRPVRGRLPLLERGAALRYLDRVRERTRAVLAERWDDDLVELVLRHELQHGETMLQAIELAGLEAGVARRPRTPTGLTGLERVAVPGGTAWIGAPDDGFAYDNERPRHATDVRGFRIGRAPITNATYLHFVEGGGYERRPWWSFEAWCWKEEHDITHPGGWVRGQSGEWLRRRGGGLAPLDPGEPVVHLSFHEAAAFARSQGARLPTEVEWEHAATAGLLEDLGAVWEWTSSPFRGYPGFRAHPYPEYSEVFFGDRHRVLRGGSWATHPRVASPSFRNWDLPQRRQIFAGVRLAWDV